MPSRCIMKRVTKSLLKSNFASVWTAMRKPLLCKDLWEEDFLGRGSVHNPQQPLLWARPQQNTPHGTPVLCRKGKEWTAQRGRQVSTEWDDSWKQKRQIRLKKRKWSRKISQCWSFKDWKRKVGKNPLKHNWGKNKYPEWKKDGKIS